MRKEVLTWETSIQAVSIQKDELWHTLKSTFPQTLKYPLTAMTLTRAECQIITSPIVKYSLPQAILIITIHTAVIYVPLSLEVIVIMDLFLQKGVGQIIFLVEHTCTKKVSKTLLLSNLSSLQIEAGCNRNILDRYYKYIHQFIHNPSWIRDTWKICQNIASACHVYEHAET